ncbi:hypothetical protein CUC15_04815 [Oceanobacillus zhaokaii]|uniref:Uncharacterized protein n=1 Tax=Oceanobacillus zhaokaii TaxID=2052660 RepID=A0A345PE65_9BACI|nr:hypothetical protein CUC15_04815 [Oceanobacillus zhaokaii]
MSNFIRLIICCLIIFLVFWSIDFTSELSLFTITFSSIALGYGLNMFWKLYKKFQMNVEDR